MKIRLKFQEDFCIMNLNKAELELLPDFYPLIANSDRFSSIPKIAKERERRKAGETKE